ncbi:MAG: phosphate acyltransferase PlsX [bacterium]
MIRIAVDAMGGDNAPQEIVNGVIEAARRSSDRFELILVGDKTIIEEELTHHHFIKKLPLSIVHAPQIVGMDESAVKSFKEKKDSSIAVAVRLHKEKKVDAVVSAGNTGAVMTNAHFYLHPIQGVDRPAIGTLLPNQEGVGLLIDVGSNVNIKASNFQQFGIMGSIFMQYIIGIKSPRVGLLNIGEEESKGGGVLQQAHRLLSQSTINFIGNIEGRDILKGTADVVVCDGFVGNILLKFAESLAGLLSKSMKRTIRGNLPGTIGLYLLRPSLRKLFKMFDYQEYGGAPLLGVNGNCVISHGSSSARAIKNAIEEAFNMVKNNITQQINERIKAKKGEIGEK